MQRMFVKECAGGRYKPGDHLDRPMWWWRGQPQLWDASRPMDEVMRVVAEQLGEDALQAATGEPAPPQPTDAAKRRAPSRAA